ncbi:hypothetical protein ACFS07_22715 [Undibacterium arcticum]
MVVGECGKRNALFKLKKLSDRGSMMDTNNLRIGARLSLAFGIVLTLMIAILVASSMVGTKKIASR